MFTDLIEVLCLTEKFKHISTADARICVLKGCVIPFFMLSSKNKKNKKAEIWSQWWTKSVLVFGEHECKLYHLNFGGRPTGKLWLMADKSTSWNKII